ncbi:hypothetical protein AB0I60_04500 [Actinosynnema sp. NPDC050436]|uniref:hypothetical protein n=1 Tax=Actinosynnema sp. NPDC050436 TaxID=3155659 RepID=UPI0033DDE982
MLEKLISAVDCHLADKGLPGLIKATGGLLAFGSVLGASFGSAVVTAAFLLAGALCVVGALAVLARSRAVVHTKLLDREELVGHYCDLIYDEIQPLWRIDRWEETAEVAPNGDVCASILVHAFVQRDQLGFYRVRLGPNFPQAPAVRRKVQVDVTGIEVGEFRGDQCERTSRWLADGRLEVLVHFPADAPRKGEEVILRFEVRWPGKAAPLMLGRTDEFVMKMGNPLAYLRYRVTLPAGASLRATPVDLDAEKDAYRLTTTTTSGGRPVAELVAHDIAADRRFGMRLELA